MSRLFPPRPETKICPEDLPKYDNGLYVAQYKLNGTNSPTETLGGGLLDSYTRHLDDHKLWTPETSKALEPLRDLPRGYTFVPELMHSKVKGGPKDTLYIHDLITSPDEDLFGETYEARYQMILDLLNPEDHGDPDHLVVTPHLWVARNLTSGFKELFEGIKCPWHEGLVLKRLKGKLNNCNKPTSNSNWQVKCRVPHENYSF